MCIRDRSSTACHRVISTAKLVAVKILWGSWPASHGPKISNSFFNLFIRLANFFTYVKVHIKCVATLARKKKSNLLCALKIVTAVFVANTCHQHHSSFTWLLQTVQGLFLRGNTTDTIIILL